MIRRLQRESMTAATDTRAISTDLSWIDLVKGIAIIGVFFDNWTSFMRFTSEPALLRSAAEAFSLAVGPFVQVFFILSGFGLTVAYFRQSRTDWSWKRWAWRRITKIVLPYEIFVVFSLTLGMLGSALHASIDVQFSWKCLLAYLTFMRNFFPQCWGWNPPLWFMPVIIGLYISYPVLIMVLRRWGPWILLLISAVVTYATLTIAVLAGGAQGHGADLFTFWMIQFALGIVLAHVRETAPEEMHHLLGAKAFLVGVGIMILSWVLRTYVPLGKSFNDSVTSVGIFLILLNVVWTGRARFPATGMLLGALGRVSYLMYLMHWPIMEFLIGPPLQMPMNPIVVLVLGAIYVLLIYLLCWLVSKPMHELTTWAYHRYYQ